jgi:hypothetical protein
MFHRQLFARGIKALVARRLVQVCHAARFRSLSPSAGHRLTDRTSTHVLTLPEADPIPIAPATGPWGILLEEPDQPASVAHKQIFKGTITNQTGRPVLLNGVGFSFDTPAAPKSYVLDWAQELLDTGGIISTKGYRGPIFTLTWLTNPPIGTVNSGEITFEAEESEQTTAIAPFSSPYKLQTLSIRSDGEFVILAWLADDEVEGNIEAADELNVTTLESPVWLPVGVLPQRNGNTNEVRIPRNELRSFYRLHF